MTSRVAKPSTTKTYTKAEKKLLQYTDRVLIGALLPLVFADTSIALPIQRSIFEYQLKNDPSFMLTEKERLRLLRYLTEDELDEQKKVYICQVLQRRYSNAEFNMAENVKGYVTTFAEAEASD